MKKILFCAIRICFVAAAAVVFFAGLGRTVFDPKPINSYENRQANQLPELSLSAFLAGEYQSGVEDALSDQVQLSERMKEIYNRSEANISISLIRETYRANPDTVYFYNNMLTKGGEYLLYYPRYVSGEAQTALDARIESLAELAARRDDLDMYLYYIEKDTDIDFSSGEKTGLYDYIDEGLADADIKRAAYRINSFEEFAENFYMTDHHWNHRGSYRGYLELLEFLDCSGEPLQPGEEFTVMENFSGSKALLSRCQGVWTEYMYAYRYEFPAMSIRINGQEAADYGSQNSTLWQGAGYADYYGIDCGEIAIENGAEGRGNILIIGESYDNAVLKLLAPHFSRLYAVDLRYYEYYTGNEFDLDAYTAENDIDTVLFMGNIDYFTADEFTVR